MMGTGHLVEDYSAPFHLCGICLRKLQWRLRFSVESRYSHLWAVLKNVDLTKESAWTRRQLTTIKRTRGDGDGPQPDLNEKIDILPRRPRGG